ncbi:MAG: response regulator [Eubacteriales bacterium]|nr:response regulator [Eubacteriales bacterium]
MKEKKMIDRSEKPASEMLGEYVEQLKKQEQELKAALNSAMDASKAKSRFLSNMSHDIRTPMNAIVGYTAIASAHIHEPDIVKQSLGKIALASEHLQGLINDILDMSRIESGKETINLNRTSVPEMVRGVLPMIQAQVDRKHLELYIDTIDLKDERVYADTQKMRQILINLMSNAVKFTGEGGHIGIRVKQMKSKKEGYATYVFRVKDDGIGMSREFLKRIFDPFEQEHTYEESGKEGTGLGMTITKSFVDILGGTIEIESELGKGSEFIISLELKLQEDVQPDARLEELRGFRALVVDDDFSTCDSITRMLSDVGMRSDWTVSAKDALLRTQKAISDDDPFFAYIIDWIMPEMNGLELVRRIRKFIGNDIPIIILTAYAWGDIAEEAKEAGVTALCTKPLFASDLTTIFLDNINIDGTARMAKRMMDSVDLRFEGERVLLAEDNRLNREIAEVEMQEMGLEVICAKNGKEAVEMLEASENGHFDFVLMDMRMPVMDGVSATLKIRQSQRRYLKEIPIIALTANAFQEDVNACLEAGMNAHVAKPFDSDDLALVLKRQQKKKRCE